LERITLDIQNLTIDDYELILPKKLNELDIIIFDGFPVIIMKINNGNGAGNFFFGRYIGITFIRVQDHLKEPYKSYHDFIFERQPIIRIKRNKYVDN
jgi:hypothetical protein